MISIGRILAFATYGGSNKIQEKYFLQILFVPRKPASDRSSRRPANAVLNIINYYVSESELPFLINLLLNHY